MQLKNRAKRVAAMFLGLVESKKEAAGSTTIMKTLECLQLAASMSHRTYKGSYRQDFCLPQRPVRLLKPDSQFSAEEPRWQTTGKAAQLQPETQPVHFIVGAHIKPSCCLRAYFICSLPFLTSACCRKSPCSNTGTSECNESSLVFYYLKVAFNLPN